MNDLFEHIRPLGQELEFSDFVKALRKESHRHSDITRMNAALAEGAVDFYRGRYPTEWPYFPTGFSALPWFSEYHSISPDDRVKNTPIDQEEMGKILAAIYTLDGIDDCFPIIYSFHTTNITSFFEDYDEQDRKITDGSDITVLHDALEELKAQGLDFCDNEKLITQCLAVEALRSVDCFFENLRRGDLNGSVFWTSKAHQAIIELTQQAHKILGNTVVSEQARKAATIRHRENHAMRDQAMKYYGEHKSEFSSMDDAAWAIAGKIVPVKYRTVYEWIRRYRREIPSARKA